MEFFRDLFEVIFWPLLSKRRKKLLARKKKNLELKRSEENPILTPSHYSWESQATFNPAAIYLNGRVHLLYRAMGSGGQSVLGYASSADGITFDERLPYPVYINKKPFDFLPTNIPIPELRRYRPGIFASGGGWAGSEDPRAVVLGDRVYLLYTAFAGWDSVRVAVTSISVKNFLAKNWLWTQPVYLTPVDEVHKNWSMFPEKFNGAFLFLHNIYSPDGKSIMVEYINNLQTFNAEKNRISSPDPHSVPDVLCAWHKRTRSAGPPPIKTTNGWLVLYHARDTNDMNRYKLGAMLLDLEDPSVVTHRAQEPVLEPSEWYENDWKPGVIYVCGAIVKDGTLFAYYGGGDKHVAVATANLDDFVNQLVQDGSPKLSKSTTSI